MAPHLQPQAPRPQPGTRIPRPLATRHHAPHRRHHPPVQPRVHHPATSTEPRVQQVPDPADNIQTGAAAMTTTEPAPVMYRISDVVRLTRLSRSVIYEQIRAGRLRTVKQGTATLI